MMALKSTENYATCERGAKIVLATCSDERHPPEAVLSEKDDDFWATTGCFPQEIVVQLPCIINVSRISAETVNGAMYL
jgi:heat shock protein beta-11